MKSDDEKQKSDDETPDLFEARIKRDEGIERVLTKAGPWKKAAQAFMETLPMGWEGSGEDFRIAATAAGVGQPHKPHAWGGMIVGAVKRKMFIWTGHLTQMRIPSSHARTTKVWRRT